MRRRVRFAVYVIISQSLLIALAISWLIHMLLIEINGAVYFVEKESAILWSEIIVTIIIIIFSGILLILQSKRLGERRENDRRVELANNNRSSDTKLRKMS